MKRLFPSLLLVAISMISRAQTATFLLTATPCHNDGVLQATFTGVTPPLTVTWQTFGTSGANIIHTSVTGLTDDLTGYSGGEASVTATDGSGATATGYYTGNPPFTICPFAISTAVCPIPDTVSVSICSGGTAPFTYQWYNIATTAIVSTTDTIEEMPGSYGVTVTDASGCTFGSRVSNISAFLYAAAPAYTDSIITTIASCTNGSATIVPYGGGTPPYSCVWSNGSSNLMASGLVMGTYGVTVTDANGCQITDNASITQAVTISAPVFTSPSSCAGSDGSVSTFPSGGTPPYTYAWSNGITAYSQVGLEAGFYSVEVTDANGCIGSGSGSVAASAPIAVTNVATPSLCTAPTGNASLTISGGTPPYSVLWYTTPVQTGANAHALGAGSYIYQVTDASGCVTIGTVYVPPLDNIGISFASTAATCTMTNGSLTAFPAGGVAPYNYSWSTGASAATISGQPAGNYKVTITDHVGCSTTATQALPATTSVGVSVASTPSSCIYNTDGAETTTIWGGTAPYSYAWSTGAVTSDISALPYGPYWLSVTDASGCTSANNYSYVAYGTDNSCYCTISGTVYDDLNVNCVQDPGEQGIPNVQVQIGNMGYVYTDANGNYSMNVPSGSYTITENAPSYYPISGCQLNGIPVTVSASAGCTQTVSFANTVDTVHDVHISTWDYDLSNPVPGQKYTHVVIVSNDGNVPEDSITTSYHPDGKLFAPYITPGGYYTGAPYQYGISSGIFPALNPGGTAKFFMSYTVPYNIPAGTSVVFTDTVSNQSPIDFWQLDYTPANNIDSFVTTVSSSAMHNFKEVSPKGCGPTGIISYADSVLEFMIHFQNTAATSAENVVIVDTLDANLNAASLRPIFESAQCSVTLAQAGTKNVATFTFNDVNLPAEANDEMGSSGMLTYTVHLNSGLAVGTQIQNHASIYFDEHAPIMTNITVNAIGSAAPQSVTKVVTQSQSSFIVYPNPANNSFNAVINSDISSQATIVVSDVTGKALLSKPLTLQKGMQTVSADITQFAPGVYFVSLINDGKTQTQKLVVVK